MDVVGLGWAMLDFLAFLPHYPPENAKLECLTALRQVGGPVARAMMTLSKLGKPTALIARVGDDREGKSIREELAASGVQVDMVDVEKNGESRASMIWVSQKSASRTAIFSRGHFHELDLTPGALALIREAKFLHLDGREPRAAIAAASAAREQGCRITLDVGTLKPNVSDLIQMAHVIVIPELSAMDLFPGTPPHVAGRRIHEMGPHLVVLTSGESGALAITQDGVFQQAGFPVNAIDTNGAGDTFFGGLLYGLIEQWDVRKMVRFASAVAALKCTRLGNQGLPGLDEVNSFLETSAASHRAAFATEAQ